MNIPLVLLIASSILLSWANLSMNIAQTGTASQTDERVIEREGIAEFTETKRNHTARIIFETKLFDARKRSVGRMGNCITIDGRIPLGTDRGMPKVEIASMRFFLDGREIPIPRSLYFERHLISSSTRKEGG